MTLRQVTRAAVVLASSLLMGCYTALPVQQATPSGAMLRLVLTDAGRAVFSDSLGGSVDWLEGRLVTRDSTSYTLAMSSLRLLRGGTQVWTGERLRVRSEHVALATERRLSKSKTAALSAGALAVAAAAIIGGLDGLLQGDNGTTEPRTPPVEVRFPHR